MLPFVVLTTLATVGLLAADRTGSRSGIWVTKPVASLGFVLTALSAGALASPYGTWVLLALLLCLLGDVLLIPEESEPCFRAGIASFLLGHVAFAVAFSVLGIDALAAAVAMFVILVPLMATLRWLAPHLPQSLRASVYAYLLVIASMLVCATGAVAAGAPVSALVGGLMFAVSDLSVARDRFVVATFQNRLWGLPLYFGGQLVLASSIASA